MTLRRFPTSGSVSCGAFVQSDSSLLKFSKFGFLTKQDLGSYSGFGISGLLFFHNSFLYQACWVHVNTCSLLIFWLNLTLVENYPEPWISLPASSEVLALLGNNNSRGKKLCWLATLLLLKWRQMQNKMQGQWGPLPPLKKKQKQQQKKKPPKLHDESFLELTKIKIDWAQKINNNIKIPRKRGWTVKGKKRRFSPMSVN